MWSNLKTRLATLPSLVAEDQAGLRGFMVIEPQYPEVAVIIAAGLRDTWGVRPYLDLFLPEMERLAQAQALTALLYIGYEEWLIDNLPHYGFAAREWVLMFERFGSGLPPAAPEPATLRIAHRQDLPTIRTLDELAFTQLWHKPAEYFNEALATADSFVLAEITGEIVGYEWCEMYQKRGHLTRLAIHPTYQGRGVGAQLLRRAILDALDNGVTLLTLNTQETNLRSQALYARFGFIQTKQRVPMLWKDLE
jgi:ribosomal-protein-alanine N-acetyltransferase